jgi:type IV secretory pathway TrbL component
MSSITAALTCSVAYPARARGADRAAPAADLTSGGSSVRCGVDREFRIPDRGDGDGAGRAELRYGDVANTMAQTAARQGDRLL